jgi:hypothetical protein
MNSVVNFVEIENRIVTATYQSLMIGAKVILVDKTSDQPLPDPVTTIASPAPTGSLRIRLPATVAPGDYYLKALNGHGVPVAQSVAFQVS